MNQSYRQKKKNFHHQLMWQILNRKTNQIYLKTEVLVLVYSCFPKVYIFHSLCFLRSTDVHGRGLFPVLLLLSSPKTNQEEHGKLELLMLQVHHSWWEVVCKSSIPTAITSTTPIINWKQGIWTLNFSLFFHNLSHSDGEHNVSPWGHAGMLPAPYLGNNTDTRAFSKHRLSGELL